MRADNFERNEAGLFVPKQRLIMGGVFDCELVRGGEVIDKWQTPNLITNEGLNSVLDVYLHGASGIGAWYMGIFEGNYTPVNTDTASSIAGNSTECIAITATTRPAWTPAAPSGQSITNSASRAAFTFTGITGSKSIFGAFIHSNPTLQSTTGVLFAAARFGSSKSVVNSDQLLLTYTFNASSV